MALPAPGLSEDQFTCSICLEVFKNPVSTPCGHSFCQSCISSYWDGGRHGAKSYQCPLCKESFRKRPELHINRSLKEITEKFQLMASLSGDAGVEGIEHPRLHYDHPHPVITTHSRPGEMPESVLAEMITRFQQLTTPGLLHTNMSQPGLLHTQNPDMAFQTQHNDPPPPYSLAHRLPLCPVHLRGLEFFCRTDNTCICSTCVETVEHRGHILIPAHREWNIKKSHLRIAEVELKDLICERQRKVEEIHLYVQEMKAAAEQDTHEVVCAFSKLISIVEHCQAEVLEVISRTVRGAELRAQNLLREVEEEMAALEQKSSTLKELISTEDYVLFLKMFPVLSMPPQTKDWASVPVMSQQTSGLVPKTVNQMMEHLQEELQKLPEVCRQSSSVPSAPRPNPKVRKVQEYAVDIRLDPSTAHPRLIISADGKKVQCGERHQTVLDNPKRFDRVVCVMAQQGFSSGRHYWEVEVGKKTDWDLGVASQFVNRKGKITVSPDHGYWFLSLRDGIDYAFRTEPSTSLTVSPRPSRIGIFVDCDKGLVSFYNVEAKMLIYSFTDSFPDTIHPFFSPCTNKSGQNEAPLTICSVSE